MTFTDYYALLKISPYATNTEIRSAYLKRCKEWHPDKNPGVDTTKMMQLINQAKSILLDQSKRSAYNVEYNLYKSKSTKDSTSPKSKGSTQFNGSYTEYPRERQGADKIRINKERYAKLRERVLSFKTNDEYMYQLFQDQICQKSRSDLTIICTNWTEYSKEFLDLTIVALHEKYLLDLDTIYSLIKERNARTESTVRLKNEWSQWLFRILLWSLLAGLANAARR